MNKKIDDVLVRVERDAEETESLIKGHGPSESLIVKLPVQDTTDSGNDTEYENGKVARPDAEDRADREPTPRLVVKLLLRRRQAQEQLAGILEQPFSPPTDTIKVSERR